jgi:hypothetical protein
MQDVSHVESEVTLRVNKKIIFFFTTCRLKSFVRVGLSACEIKSICDKIIKAKLR